MFKDKTVLVTGGTGFLGKSVCNNLKNNGYENIVSVGSKSYNLIDRPDVERMLEEKKPDAVIHLAATVGGIGVNKKHPGLFAYNNLAMGMNLIDSIKSYNINCKFIMVGTVCSYPKFTPVPFKEEDIWNGFPEETNAPYGISKKTLMHMVDAYHREYGFNGVNLVPVNMYGPNDNFNPSSSHVIPALILKFYKAMTESPHAPVEIWGTGEASREFLYVDDCAEAIRLSLEKDISPEPINIGTGGEIQIKYLAHTIAEIMGYNGNIFFNSSFPDGQPRRCLDISRAEGILGYKPTVDLYEGLEMTVDWFKSNLEKFNDYLDNI
jgi:GDP-L-fucose synthase